MVGGGGGGGYDDGTGLNGVAWGGGGGGSESLDSFANASQLPIAKGVYPGGNGGSTNINCKLLNESYSPNAPYVKSTNGTGAFSKTFNGVTLQAGLGAGSNPAGCTSNYKAGSGSLEGGGGGGVAAMLLMAVEVEEQPSLGGMLIRQVMMLISSLLLQEAGAAAHKYPMAGAAEEPVEEEAAVIQEAVRAGLAVILELPVSNRHQVQVELPLWVFHIVLAARAVIK